jgi:hypothetical protein
LVRQCGTSVYPRLSFQIALLSARHIWIIGNAAYRFKPTSMMTLPLL